MPTLPSAEPTDCWKLVGVDDVATPPTVARALGWVGTRADWRRAGFPVLFDEQGNVRHVLRGGREYRFVRVDSPSPRGEASGEASGAVPSP